MAELNHKQVSALKNACREADALSPAAHEEIVYSIFATAQNITSNSVHTLPGPTFNWQTHLDKLLTSPLFGFPIMLLLLAVVFWITIEGANYPSRLLVLIFNKIEIVFTSLCMMLNVSDWLHGFLVLGVYRTTSWVIAVMLPPMAIFFPLFTLLEDLGYLPRIAFNLDPLFKKVGGHGKQALTMSMGFGCNAAGVIACRIIDSPRERLVAILTNTFVPCNGRFPTFFALSIAFLGTSPAFYGIGSGLLASGAVVAMVLLGVAVTFFTTWLLTRTLLKGIPSTFVLELPPYRSPQVCRIVVRSIFDRTMHVLIRAIAWAGPAGAITWILANTMFGSQTLLAIVASYLDGPARLLGLDGTILLAFFLGLPANEIVLPIIVMSYLAKGSLFWPTSIAGLHQLLIAYGWTAKTAFFVMLFSLLHFPCSTTLWTIFKETGSRLWTLVGFILPLILASTVLLILNAVF